LLLALAGGADVPLDAEATTDVVTSAIEHRMHGLLWELVETEELPVGREATDLLAPAVLAVRRRSRKLATTASDVSEELAEIGLEVAVFKGVAAEKRWYGRNGTRPAGDLDLWLAPHQIDRAGEAVTALHPGHPLEGQVSELASTGQIRSVDLVWKGIPVDLHFDPFKFGVWYEDLDAVWANTEDLGEGYRAMGPAAELVNALIHLNKDRFSRLLGFVDVVRASAQPEVAEAAWRLATQIGVSVPVACSAQVVGETLDVPIPIPEPRDGWRTQMWSKLWPKETWLQGNAGYAQMRRRQDLIPFLCDGQLPEAIKYLQHVWFPPRVLLDYFNPHVEGLPYPLALWKARTT